jgi:hypothetical protein
MRRYFLAAVLLGCILEACNNATSDTSKNITNDPVVISKAQKIIKEEVVTGLGKNAFSYESISFSPLDSCFENLSENADPNKEYPKIFSGFKMTHDFKALDIFNQLHVERRIFYFNAAVDKIIKVKDIGTGN